MDKNASKKGSVKIMSFVEIGTNCCIDRPAVGVTFIDEGTKMDNLVQIGHGLKLVKIVHSLLKLVSLEEQ